jgi:hypothetical protein
MEHATEIWLDFNQAAAMLGIARPRFARLIDEQALAVRLAPSGTPGVLKSDLLAWRERDRAARREALATLACGIDREVFGAVSD